MTQNLYHFVVKTNKFSNFICQVILILNFYNKLIKEEHSPDYIMAHKLISLTHNTRHKDKLDAINRKFRFPKRVKSVLQYQIGSNDKVLYKKNKKLNPGINDK